MGIDGVADEVEVERGIGGVEMARVSCIDRISKL